MLDVVLAPEVGLVAVGAVYLLLLLGGLLVIAASFKLLLLLVPADC